MDRRTAILIAEIIVTGQWSVDAATERLISRLGKTEVQRKWPRKLVEHVFQQAAFQTEAPAVRDLTAFLEHDPSIPHQTDHVIGSLSIWARNFSPVDRLAPVMSPCTVARTWQVPPIVTPGELATKFNLPVRQLGWLADARSLEFSTTAELLRNYRYHVIRKSSGGYRLLEAPKSRLKNAQRWIAENILTHIPVHDAAHAFRTQRSPVTSAGRHTNASVILKIDLRDFFPSIQAKRISGVFRTAGYPEKVVRLLTGLCTNTAWRGILELFPEQPGTEPANSRSDTFRPLFLPHLPQGSPASPALANLCAWSLDRRLAGLAQKAGATYTRYADDLVFSGDRTFGKQLRSFRLMVCAICVDEGFEIRTRKTTIMRSHHQQHVTGIVVNRRLNVARKDYDLLKAILHNCRRFGPESQNQNNHADFKAHLCGRIGWVRCLNPVKAAKLQQIYDAIDWRVHGRS